ncbi:uncharacterized protein UTRI_06073 [Ustilago trichophora]|uniref:DUF1996 domain-containing protein n=1 Tax=Ustilago trichophora TaxID=86804 RepID=A0A5C3EEN9_9BASI|nr:uncharacterized protein UTRI_06073 [Ustilago trichophora]
MVGSRNLAWSALTAWCALFAASTVSATTQDPVMWILVHHSLKTARIDPIVSPGKVSSHVHSLVGVNGVSATTTTAEDLERESTCTTAGIAADSSAYWAPSLYAYNADDTFTPQPLDYVNTYYLMRGNVPIKAFPRGLQMLAGNAMRQGPGPTRQNDNTVSFVCLNYAQGSTQTPTLPQGPCPQGLRTQVVFPSCWNGKDLISSDNSHIVYPLGDNADNGPCPDSHNIRLPTLFYEFVWGVGDQVNTGNSTWVFSNGDAIGYSFHADFIAAWDEELLQDAIDQCGGNLFNNLESCPPLAKTLDRKASDACRSTSSEATSGSIESLPGCNVVWNGPHAGKGLTKGCDPNKVMLKPANWPTSSASASSASASSTSASASSTSSTVKPSTTDRNVVILPKPEHQPPQPKPQPQCAPVHKQHHSKGAKIDWIPKAPEKKKHRPTFTRQKDTQHTKKHQQHKDNNKKHNRT